MKIKRFWVARDIDGALYLYDRRPSLEKHGGYFYSSNFWGLSDELFPSLTFENSPKEVCFITPDNEIIVAKLLNTDEDEK